jgi:hypothetical protein
MERTRTTEETTMTKHYEISDGVSDTQIEADGARDAEAQARDWIEDGDYGQAESTSWVDVQITEIDKDGEELEDGAEWSLTVTMHPPEPDCIDGHDHHYAPSGGGYVRIDSEIAQAIRSIDNKLGDQS